MIEFILGLLIGGVIVRLFLTPKHIGTLVVYETEPDEPDELYLELDKSTETVSKSEYAIFKVKNVHK